MADGVVLNKAAGMERCLKRAAGEFKGYEDGLESDDTRQDAIVPNLLRASEAAMDLAMHEARVGKLGLPRESREAFALLDRAGWIGPDLSRRMQAMVGFRGIAVRDNWKLDLEVVKSIFEDHLDDFRAFAAAVPGIEIVSRTEHRERYEH